MLLHVDFGPLYGSYTPDQVDLSPFFSNPGSPDWFPEGRTDNASLVYKGLRGAAPLTPGSGSIDATLELWGSKMHGVMIWYRIGTLMDSNHYFSKGDMLRIRRFYRTAHGDLRPLAFFIPFERALVAVKEFISTNGELPKSIEWISSNDVPPNTFPEPHDPEFEHIR